MAGQGRATGRTPAALALMLLATLAAGCLLRPAPPGPVEPDPEPVAVRFAVVGDTGTGDENEYAAARAVGQACQDRGCDFIVHTGDILYDVGAFSVHDTQFEDKFERPYGSLGLPVYLVLGNHDVGGDVHAAEDLHRWQEVGDRAVAYSHRTDRTTDAWRMPARWYNVTHGPAAFAAFDTTAFLWASLEADPGGPLHRAVSAQEALAASAWPDDAAWRFAVGHHPYVSNGQHGNTEDYRDEGIDGTLLGRFYEEHVCGRADLILAGHDHDLQLLQPVPGCGATRFLVSGAGARPRSIEDPWRNEALFQAGGVLGFWWLEAKGDRLQAVAIDAAGMVLFEATLLKAEPAEGDPAS